MDDKHQQWWSWWSGQLYKQSHRFALAAESNQTISLVVTSPGRAVCLECCLATDCQASWSWTFQFAQKQRTEDLWSAPLNYVSAINDSHNHPYNHLSFLQTHCMCVLNQPRTIDHALIIDQPVAKQPTTTKHQFSLNDILRWLGPLRCFDAGRLLPPAQQAWRQCHQLCEARAPKHDL